MGTRSKKINNVMMKRKSAKVYYKDSGSEVILLEEYSNPEKINNIANELGLSYQTAAALLTNKQFKSMEVQNIKDFIETDIKISHPLETYPETLEAIEILKNSISSGEKIGIYGDYDGDGVTSSLILYEGLSNIVDTENLEYDFSRIQEDGFSFSIRGLEYLAEKGCKTIIVVDTGSNSPETLKKAKEMGIKVIVMDHHNFNSDTEKIEGITYINPHLHSEESNEEELKNAGMSWYFMKSLYNDMKIDDTDLYGNLLGYAALGTISDAGNQLEGRYNRALLHFGTQPDILKNVGYIPQMAEIEGEELYDMGDMRVISAIQALSIGKRIGTVHPSKVFTALSKFTPEEERKEVLEYLKDKTKEFNDRSSQASNMIINKFKQEPSNIVIEVADESVVPPEFLGTSGSVSGRVTRMTGKPSIIFVKAEDGAYKGSYRTGDSQVDGLEMLERLHKKYPEIMKAHGGHRAAGGLTIESVEKIEEFKDLVTKFIDYQNKRIPGYIPQSKTNNNKSVGKKHFVVGEVNPAEIVEDNFKDIFDFTPFDTFTLKKPKYFSRGVTVKKITGDSVILETPDGEEKAFFAKNIPAELTGKTLDIIFSVIKKADTSIGFNLEDFEMV